MSSTNFIKYSSNLAYWHLILKQKEHKSNWIASYLIKNQNFFSTLSKKREPIKSQSFSSYINYYPIIKPVFGYILFPNENKLKANFLMSHCEYSSSCELTAKRYSITRGSFNEVKESDVNFFKSFLDNHQVITSKDELEGPNTDWLSSVKGYSPLMLRPKTTEEVSKLLAYCNKRNLSVCPQGGNTGLVGGSVPVFDEIILSTSLMNKVESLDEYSGALICQSGCVLETLDHYVAEHGLMMPLDLGAKGSCHIGGNISTNAGGLRLLRYGSLQGSVLGIEAVLASGQIIDCLSAMKKDNTGYGLKHLFIGSEGTLGIVTKVSIHCPVRPASSTVAFLGLENFKNVLQTFKEARTSLGEILSSCEFIDQYSLDAVTSHLMLTSPIDRQKFYILIEASGSNATHDGEKLSRFLDKSMEDGLIVDGTVVTEPSKMLEIWGLRERIAEALLMDGYTYKYDVSLPLPVFYEVVEEMQDRLRGHVTRCCGYGHIGDGNLHFNVTTPAYNKNVLDLIEPYFYQLTASHQGSISAEHGLGFKKKNFMGYSRSASSIALMKQLKALMDPKGILNPYKLLPEN